MGQQERQDRVLSQGNQRNSNIELLRLLCVLLIVSMHVFGLYSSHLGLSGLLALSFNNTIGNLGVSVFMLISGYFGIRFRLSKLLGLWNVAWFWSVVLAFVVADFSSSALVHAFFPILTDKYWFLTAYMVIFCLSPFIESLVHAITRRQFLWLIGVLALFFVVAPTLLKFEITSDSGKGVVNMMTVYLIGRYMALYGLPRWTVGLRGAVLLAVVVVMVTVFDFILSVYTGTLFQLFARDNSIFMLLGAIALFCCAAQLKPCSIPWINQLAGYVFPIYVIHVSLLPLAPALPASAHDVLYLVVWAFTIGLSLLAIVLELLRRGLLTKAFNGLLEAELSLSHRISKTMLKWT